MKSVSTGDKKKYKQGPQTRMMQLLVHDLQTSSNTLHKSKSLCSLNGSMFLLMVPLKRTGS